MEKTRERVNERMAEARLRLICNGEPTKEETVNLALMLSKCRIEIVNLAIKDYMQQVRLAETENNRRGM